MVERLRLKKRNQAIPLDNENWPAVKRILDAWNAVEAAEVELRKAKLDLEEQVNQAPVTVMVDYEKFYRAGGCSREQYKAWIEGRASPDPVKRKKHLRLVAHQGPRPVVRRRFVYHRNDGPPDAA